MSNAIAQAMLTEFEAEAPGFRKCLERIPADQLAWKAHRKSMSIGQLGLHIASAAGGIARGATLDEMPTPDMDSSPKEPESLEQILQTWDASVATVRELLPAMDDQRMAGTWKMVNPDGSSFLEMPRQAFLRSILLNHLYHHRGQLCVYLRLLGAPVPAIYGPSADEMPDGTARAAEALG